MSPAVETILDLARWAPSGDNTQPWRFEVIDDTHIAIHGFDTRDHVVYDFDGHPSQMAHGALLETLRIAATGSGFAATWALRDGQPDTAPIYDVTLTALPGIAPDPLIDSITKRSVQRRPMKTTPLTDAEKSALAAAPGPGYKATFIEAFAGRKRVAGLLWDNARIRLTCPEAYPVHRDIIEWGVQYSTDRIPSPALGVDAGTEKLMHWILKDWKRVDFFNRYMAGTVAPRVQLDFLPAIFCAAHVALTADQPPRTTQDYVRAGVALQRLWLTVTHLGLYLQPEMTPLIFRWYAAAKRKLSANESINQSVDRLAIAFDQIVKNPELTVFFCRVGRGSAPKSRSIRRELRELLRN